MALFILTIKHLRVLLSVRLLVILLLSWKKNIGFREILVAEAMALCEGLEEILDFAHKKIIVEGDSKTLIDAINGRIDVPWWIKFLVHDIHTLVRGFSDVVFRHIFTEVNFIADNSVDFGHSTSSSLLLHNQSGFDKFGSRCFRRFCL